MENTTNQSSQIFNGPQQPLPNATAVLILGILSLPSCCFYGTGLILGIIAIVLANKDGRTYRLNPSAYTMASYNNTKAGKICAIIGIVISSLYGVCLIIAIAMFGFAIISNPQALQEALHNMQH